MLEIWPMNDVDVVLEGAATREVYALMHELVLVCVAAAGSVGGCLATLF